MMEKCEDTICLWRLEKQEAMQCCVFNEKEILGEEAVTVLLTDPDLRRKAWPLTERRPDEVLRKAEEWGELLWGGGLAEKPHSEEQRPCEEEAITGESYSECLSEEWEKPEEEYVTWPFILFTEARLREAGGRSDCW